MQNDLRQIPRVDGLSMRPPEIGVSHFNTLLFLKINFFRDRRTFELENLKCKVEYLIFPSKIVNL